MTEQVDRESFVRAANAAYELLQERERREWPSREDYVQDFMDSQVAELK